MSINDAKCTVLPSFLASSITSFLFLTFVCRHAGISRVCSILHPLLLSHLFLNCLRRKNKLVQALSRGFSGFNDACTFFLGVSGVRQVSLCDLSVILQGIAAGIGTINFLRAF